MNRKTSRLKIASALLTLLVAAGCSKRSSDPSAAESDSEQPSVASKQMASNDDKTCEEILKSPDIMEAGDWLKRYPKGLFSSHAISEKEHNGTPLAPVVARLSAAGAQRVVIHYAASGQGHILRAVIVVLPTGPAGRQKVFAMDAELSRLCEQERAKDHGQKYLYYTMD